VLIHWGDPKVGRSFNVRRFINAHDFLPKPRRLAPRLPYAPHSQRSTDPPTLFARAARKLNGVAGKIEQRAWVLAGFDALVDRIIAVDRNDDLYLWYLREPLLIGNTPPDRSAWNARWTEIFAAA
jgi:hypothetical protein